MCVCVCVCACVFCECSEIKSTRMRNTYRLCEGRCQTLWDQMCFAQMCHQMLCWSFWAYQLKREIGLGLYLALCVLNTQIRPFSALFKFSFLTCELDRCINGEVSNFCGENYAMDLGDILGPIWSSRGQEINLNCLRMSTKFPGCIALKQVSYLCPTWRALYSTVSDKLHSYAR